MAMLRALAAAAAAACVGASATPPPETLWATHLVHSAALESADHAADMRDVVRTGIPISTNRSQYFNQPQAVQLANGARGGH